MSERITRRSALAGLAVAPWILPARLRAQPPGEQVRLAAIGCGNQGLHHLKKLAKQLVAVCDVDRDRLAAAQTLVATRSGREVRAVADYRELLDSKDIDGVVVATPDHWHALPTVHACQAGKDVFVEKPLALTIAEGQVMVAAARKHGRIVQVGSQQRSDAKFRRACELVRDGRLGKLSRVLVGLPGCNFEGPLPPDADPPAALDYRAWLGPAPERPYNPKRVHYNFRFFWDYSGGQATNWGAHHLDIVQWALRMDESGPVAVEAWADSHPEGWYEVPMRSEATFTYADGTPVVCQQGNKTEARQGITFEGSAGRLFVTRGKLEAEPAGLLDGETKIQLPASADHHDDWIECIKTRNRPVADVAIGHRSATVCHLLNLAARTASNRHSGEGYRDVGRIDWDPGAEKVVAHVGKGNLAALIDRPARAPYALPSLDSFR